jgi:hypothetical protein
LQPRRTAGGYLALDQGRAVDQGATEDNGAGGDDADGEEAGEESLSADALVRLWPALAASARLDTRSGGGGGVGDGSPTRGGGDGEWAGGSVAVAGSDAARAVGALSAALGAVLAGLDEQGRLRRQLQGVRRLPPFARRDAAAALTSQLAGLAAGRAAACRTLTGLAQSAALRALLPAGAKRAAADALEALALAWQAARTDEAGSGGHSRSERSGSSKSRSGGHSSAGGREGLGEAVRCSARAAVGAAQAVLNEHASKRRNGLAAERQRPPGSSVGPAVWAHAGEDADGPKSARALLPSPPRAPFDVFARGASVCSGAGWAARQSVGPQRAAEMRGAVHLSRHCAYAPSFADVAGLSVAVRRPPQAPSGATLNTQATFPRRAGEVPVAEKEWVLDHSNGGVGRQSSSGVGLKAEFGGDFGGRATGASAAARQRAKDGRRGPGEGKENGTAGEDPFDLGGLGLGLTGSRVAPPALLAPWLKVRSRQNLG